VDTRFVKARHDVVERAYGQLLGVVPLVLGVVLVSVAVAHLATNVGPLSMGLSAASLVIGVLLCALPYLTAGTSLSPNVVRGILLLALTCGAADALAAQWVSGNIGRSADLMLLVIATGVVLPERRWHIAGLALTAGPWLAFTLIAAGPAIVHQLLSVAAAVGVSLAVRRARVLSLEDTAVAEVTVVSTTTDTLTGVNNRRGLDLVGTHLLAIARREGTDMGCTYVAVPGLEVIASDYQDEVVEQILATVARALNASTRATDVVGRVSPDTFVVLSHGSGATVPMLTARLTTALELTCEVPTSIWDRNLDFGRSLWRAGDETDLVALMQAAEEDLHARAGWDAPSQLDWAAQEAAFEEHIREAGIDEDLRREVLARTSA
jgi:diguanylate cyclase (GGDEF)-like protein